MSAPRVVVVRHGETEWSATRRHTGRSDVPLTTAGERSAHDLAMALADRTFALVLTSPLQRAAMTCAAAGYADRAVVDQDLVEWDYGTIEGRTGEDIRAELPGWSIWTHGAPGGEGVAEVAGRARRVLDRALAASGDVLVFGHGHALRMLAACWLELPPVEGRRLLLGTACTGELDWDHGVRALGRWNVAAT